ncbi:MAG: hypothetical protein Q8K12_12675 [Thiobacillus sp.]|nr:hypothetical protein [Thiobacillus sp.]
MLADALHPAGVEGRWVDADSFVLPACIPNDILHPAQFRCTHFIGIYEFKYHSALQLLIHEFLLLPRFDIWRDKLTQYFFNKQRLVRKERINVLRLILEATVRERRFTISSVSLASRLYSNRWVFHPDKDEMLSYCTLLLDSLASSGDIVDERGSYRFAPQALSTLAQYEEDERKHRDMIRQQSALKWLTVALVVVGLIQALITWKN